MPIVYDLPCHFVSYLLDPGLSTTAGDVPLNQYMSKSIGNGGNDNTAALVGQVRWMKDKKSGRTLNAIVGGERMDILAKGQGHPDDFVAVMNFLCDNQEALAKVRLSVVRRPAEDRNKVVTEKTGNVYDLYFKENRDVDALKMMVRDRFFGIDCIGFVANYLIYTDLWTKYQGREIDQWDQVFPKKVDTADAVRALNLLVWPGIHVAIIDWVWDVVDKKTVKVDICQSSSGGPQCNEGVYLTDTGTTTAQGRKLFKFSGTDIPVKRQAYILSMPGLSYEQAQTD